MSDAALDTPVVEGRLKAADGTPLKRKLAQALFRSRVRAFGLAFPLVAFVIAAFIIPIVSLLWQLSLIHI